MVLALVQPHSLGQLRHRAVDARAESLPVQRLQLLAELALAPAHQRRVDRNPLARGLRHDAIHNLLRRLARDRQPALRTVRLAHRCVQQPQIVVDLRDCAHRRARAARGRLLLDGDRRREAIDGVHIRPLHLVQKLPRVGRERLYITPLSLGVDGVEGERGLARPREPRHHGQRIARDRDREVAQVVLPRAAHRDVSDCHANRIGRALHRAVRR